jgi:hypothetical protein
MDQPGDMGLVSCERGSIPSSWSGVGFFLPPVLASMPLTPDVQVQPEDRVLDEQPSSYCESWALM